MIPPHQCLGREHLAGSHVDLGKVLQEQRAVLDDVLQVQFDVIAIVRPQRHLVGEHGDLIAAGPLRRQHGLIGPTKQIRCGVPTGGAEGDADADRPRQHLAIDVDAFAKERQQSVREVLGC